jgi:hypothetical protein
MPFPQQRWRYFHIFNNAGWISVHDGGIAFLAALIAASNTHIAAAPESADLMARYAAAGRTTFKRVTKGR